MSPRQADDSNYATSAAPWTSTWNPPPRAMSATFPPTGSEPPVRAELVARVRRAIQQGTYETPEKWAITVRRILQVLRGKSVNLSPDEITSDSAPNRLDNTPPPSPPIPPPE
ncbi:MAG: flagellar biosynthesis anti-sigma factor FlgM [Gemmatales bacterium]|nr:flagellar biosynthesis anti-sigma factor FlgM [Gemmatales bacterium]MDW7994005.1 flagellar biosynthesis anti-sigma factor FlgM [Gemmatales bacterium]